MSQWNIQAGLVQISTWVKDYLGIPELLTGQEVKTNIPEEDKQLPFPTRNGSGHGNHLSEICLEGDFTFYLVVQGVHEVSLVFILVYYMNELMQYI